MNIDIHGLQAFARIAELGTFHKAAQALHLSQSALSRRISKLEEELGVRLLDRTTRKVRLTAVGRDFLPQARRLIEDLENSLAGLRDMAKRRLPKWLFEFVDRGTEDEVALRNNRDAFERIKLRPRTLVDVSERKLDTVVFGKSHSMPIGIALGVAGVLGLYLSGGADAALGLLTLAPYGTSASFILTAAPCLSC